MQRKVMVACVGVAAVLIFARLFGSGAWAGWDEGDAYSNASRPAVAAPAAAALPAVAGVAVMAGAGPSAPTAPVAPTAQVQSTAPSRETRSSATPSGGLDLRSIEHARAPGLAAAALLPTATSVAAPASPANPIPAPTVAPASTETPPLEPTAQPEAQEGPALNGVPLDSVVVLAPGVGDHVRQIFAAGQARGRNPRAFSKIGDSTMAWPPLLAAFEARGAYQLGSFDYLAPTVERFAGSFGRSSAAVKKGMHTWTEFDPAWVNSTSCRKGETPLACELRLNNPSVVFIRLGANDYNQPDTYKENLQQIIEYCVAQGVIPVLGTKPDRLEGPQNTINQIVYQMAADYSLPLWDYDRIADTVPGKGLMSDGTHFLDGGSHNYTSPGAFKAADSLEDLTALMMLDALSKEIEAR